MKTFRSLHKEELDCLRQSLSSMHKESNRINIRHQANRARSIDQDVLLGIGGRGSR